MSLEDLFERQKILPETLDLWIPCRIGRELSTEWKNFVRLFEELDDFSSQPFQQDEILAMSVFLDLVQWMLQLPWHDACSEEVENILQRKQGKTVDKWGDLVILTALIYPTLSNERQESVGVLMGMSMQIAISDGSGIPDDDVAIHGNLVRWINQMHHRDMISPNFLRLLNSACLGKRAQSENDRAPVFPHPEDYDKIHYGFLKKSFKGVKQLHWETDVPRGIRFDSNGCPPQTTLPYMVGYADKDNSVTLTNECRTLFGDFPEHQQHAVGVSSFVYITKEKKFQFGYKKYPRDQEFIVDGKKTESVTIPAESRLLAFFFIDKC